MAEAMLDLAAAGVDVLRLDAVPFLWKRVGTDCQNQPEVHELLAGPPRRDADRRARRRLQGRGDRLAARARRLPRRGRHEGKECDLAYHNALMVLLWSALASRRVALMTSTLRSMPPMPPGAGWVTYVRCHDDIGWAITDEDAAAVGEDAAPAPRASSATSTPATSRARSRAARASSPTRDGRGAHQRHRRVAGRPRGARPADGPSSWRAPRPAPVRRRVRLRRPAADLHGRRARPAQRRRLAATTRPDADDNRWMHRPPMDWDAAAAPPRPGDGRGPAVGGPARARRRCAARPARPTPTATASPSGPATTTSSGCAASTPATRSRCWRTSRPSRSPRATSPCEPYGYAWLAGDAP